jgi:hypothetical protein
MFLRNPECPATHPVPVAAAGSTRNAAAGNHERDGGAEMPDIYERNEPELVRILEQKLYEHLMREGLL